MSITDGLKWRLLLWEKKVRLVNGKKGLGGICSVARTEEGLGESPSFSLNSEETKRTTSL